MPAPARNNQKLNGRDTKDQHSYIQKSLLWNFLTKDVHHKQWSDVAFQTQFLKYLFFSPRCKSTSIEHWLLCSISLELQSLYLAISSLFPSLTSALKNTFS
jgi:hypothetical protein